MDSQLQVRIEEALRQVIAEAIEAAIDPNSAAPYAAGGERPEKMASRSRALYETGIVPVREYHSVPGALSTFYLSLGCDVYLHDSDEKELGELAQKVKERFGNKAHKGEEPKSNHLRDLDPVGMPTAEELREAAEKNCVIVFTDGTLSQRQRFPSHSVPETLVEFGLYETGTPWKEVAESQEEIWKRIAAKLGRKLVFAIEKPGSAPALYGVLA